MIDNKTKLIALGVVGVLILALLGYLFLFSEEEQPVRVVQQPEPTPLQTPVDEPEPEPVVPDPVPEPVLMPEAVLAAEPELVSVPVVAPEPEPVAAPQEQQPLFVLPAMSESDQLIRDGVTSLTDHGGITDWLIIDELIRKFVVLVDNVARGNVPRQHIGFLAPRGKFAVTGAMDETHYIDEKSYSRYDLVTEIFISIDTRRAVEFYTLVKPLFQQAFEELGYPDRRFDDVMFIGIGRLLETPDVPQPIELVQPSVVYKFANPRVERLSAAQKQLIRMGPKNTRVIKEKLSEVALELRAALEY